LPDNNEFSKLMLEHEDAERMPTKYVFIPVSHADLTDTDGVGNH